jgi:endonuclease/exonuclease/phosphatase family metal-dependent hydrolase
VFESLENGSRYVHMNTHLDVNSAAIRESELTVLLPRVKNFIDEGYAVVLTGDFNSEEETAVYKTITSSGLADSKYQTTNASRIPTYNGFADDVSKYEGPIDYCFVNSEIKVTLYRVIDKQDGGFLSDHNAIYSEMTIYPR